jgi:hypothetical protein
MQQLDLVLSLPSLAIAGNPLTGRHRLLLETAKGEVHVQSRTADIDRIAACLI